MLITVTIQPKQGENLILYLSVDRFIMSTKQAQNYTLMHLFWCPEWGSNPHLEDFKSSASAIGLSGLIKYLMKCRVY